MYPLFTKKTDITIQEYLNIREAQKINRNNVLFECKHIYALLLIAIYIIIINLMQ